MKALFITAIGIAGPWFIYELRNFVNARLEANRQRQAKERAARQREGD